MALHLGVSTDTVSWALPRPQHLRMRMRSAWYYVCLQAPIRYGNLCPVTDADVRPVVLTACLVLPKDLVNHSLYVACTETHQQCHSATSADDSWTQASTCPHSGCQQAQSARPAGICSVCTAQTSSHVSQRHASGPFLLCTSMLAGYQASRRSKTVLNCCHCR